MPRTLLAGERTNVSASHIAVYHKIEITDPDGAWKDVSTGIQGVDWFNWARLSEDLDSNSMRFSMSLLRDTGAKSMSPLMEASLVNRNAAAAYAPMLELRRKWRVSVAVVLQGNVPAGGDYREIGTGYIDRVDINEDSSITVTGRDLGAILLDAYINVERSYGSVGGTAMETVAQSIVDDNATENGYSGIVVYTPTSPGFLMNVWKQLKGNVMQALNAVAAKKGGVLKYRYDSAHASRPTLWFPNRTQTVEDFTLGPTEYLRIPVNSLDFDGVRTLVRVRFWDSATNAILTVVSPATETSTSITKYGRRVFEIDLSADDQINTTAKAQTFADNVRLDTETPAFEQQVESYGLWFVQLGDYIKMEPNAVHSDVNQFGAVSSIDHFIANGTMKTTLGLKGKPAGRYRTWTAEDGGTIITTPPAGPETPLPPVPSITQLDGEVDDTIWNLRFAAVAGSGGGGANLTYTIVSKIGSVAKTTLFSGNATTLPRDAAIARHPRFVTAIMFQVTDTATGLTASAYISVPARREEVTDTGNPKRGRAFDDGKWTALTTNSGGTNLDSTVVESGLKPVNRLYAKLLAGDADSIDSVVNGVTYSRPLATRISAGRPFIDFAEADNLNKHGGNINRDSADATKINLVYQQLSNAGHAISTMQESGTKPVNRLFAKVLAGDADTIDSAPDGVTYKKITGVSGGLVQAGSIAAAAVDFATKVSGTKKPANNASAGAILNFNPDVDDPTIWPVSVITTISDGVTGNSVLYGSAGEHVEEAKTFPWDQSRHYRISALIRKTAGVTSGTVYLGIKNFDAAGVGIGASTDYYSFYSYAAVSLLTTFVRHSVEFPPGQAWPGTARAAVHVILGYLTTTGGRVEYQDVRVEDITDIRSGFSNYSGALKSVVTESGTKPVNRLFAKVLAGDADTLDGAPDGITYKRIAGVSGGLVQTGSIAASAVDFASQVSGAQKPANNADVTSANTSLNTANVDSVSAATARQGAVRSNAALDASNLLITGISSAAKYVDGVTTIEGRKPAEAGANVTETRTSADTAAVAGTAAATVQSGAARGQGGFTNATGGLVATATESGAKLVNRLLAKTLAADPDNADSVLTGVVRRVPVVGATDATGNVDLSLAGVTNKTLVNIADTATRFASPVPNATSDVVLVASAGIALGGNNATKVSGASWGEQVYSKDGYTGGAFAQASPPAVAQDAMFGLNTDPTTDASYTSIDYAINAADAGGGIGGLYVYESGISIGNIGTFVANDIIAVTYDGSNVRYLRNGTVLRTVAAGAGIKFYFDSSFATGSLNNIRFGPMSSNNAASVGAGALGTGITESGGKPINRLLAKTLAGDSDNFDGLPEGSVTYRKTTTAQRDGGGRAISALDASNLLITGISAAAKYADGTTGLDARKPAEAGANVTETRTSADTALVAGTAAATVQSGAARGQGGFSNASGALVSGATESGTKPVNRLLAKLLAGDADSLDGAPDGLTYKRITGVSGGLVQTSSVASAAIGPTQAQGRFRCKATLAFTPTLTNNTDYTIPFNSEVYDIGDMHTIGLGADEKLTVPTGGNVGVWRLMASIGFAANATGYREITIVATGLINLGTVRIPAVSGASTIINLTVEYDAPSVGQSFHVIVKQNSGGNLNLDTNANYTYFTAHHSW